MRDKNSNHQNMDFIINEKEVLERQATHLIGTLGHVSEGKSTFIRALTGVKTQRHQKEQERNITIHLGYANTKIYQNPETGEIKAQKTSDPKPEGWDLVAHLSFVDCPGHEAFLATMLGGASIMDTACLIIATNQETIPQPQTLEHLIAAHLMGLDRYIILQNKCDLVSKEDSLIAYDKIKGFLKDTMAENAPLYPISAQHEWNTEEALSCILAMKEKEKNLSSPSQLTCVRSFDVNKPTQWISGESKMVGGVVGGCLSQGVLVKGDWIEVRPGFLTSDGVTAQPLLTQVTGIRCEENELPYAIPGSLIAIQTTLDPSFTATNRFVGQRIGVPGTLPPIVGDITIQFRNLKRDSFPFGKAKQGERVKVCANVMTVEGTIVDIPDKKTRKIRLDKPLCLAKEESVAILRMNSDAGRELLEGCGVVKEFEEWDSVRYQDYSKVEKPNRNIIWVPADKPTFSEPPYNYSDLLDSLYETKDKTISSESQKLKLKEPVLEGIPKHTIWVNWNAISSSLESGRELFDSVLYSDHLREWICKELATTATLNSSKQLILSGRWKLNAICNLLRKYINLYKKCKQCQKSETTLVKRGKLVKVWCDRCRTDSCVDY